jgi:class 3 adenylate cyclase
MEIQIAEVNIAGDCVWGVFNTKTKTDVQSVFITAFQISSLIKIMNYHFKKNNMKEISVGMGLADGQVLMIKAGYKGSKISEVLWMGDVVNESSHLASNGNKDGNEEMMVSDLVYSNLAEEQTQLLKRNNNLKCYHGKVTSKGFDEWYDKNCK